MNPRDINAFMSENATPYSWTEMIQFTNMLTRGDDPMRVNQTAPSIMTNGENTGAKSAGKQRVKPTEQDDSIEVDSEEMKILILQDIVPGCKKVIGKSSVIFEIINYFQSLQRQVEFLSRKLATVNSRWSPRIEEEFAFKDLGQQAFDTERMKFLEDIVLGSNMIKDKSTVFDDIINRIQSLQRQVEFLSMRLTCVNSVTSFTIEDFPSKDFGQRAFDMASVTFVSQAPRGLGKGKFLEEPYFKWLSSRSTESLPQDEPYEDEGKSFDADSLNLELTLEDATKQKKQMLCLEKVYEPGEASSAEDVEFTMTSEPHHPSCLQSINSLSQQEGEEETVVLDPSAQKLILEDAPQIQNKWLLGVENANTDIHFVNKTCEVVTSETDKNSEEDIILGSLTKHFGRPLGDAAKSFCVSRSTFKRICRRHGIKRWKSGKRRIGNNIFSKLERNLNNEVPSKINFSSSGLSPVQDTGVDANTIQEVNKITVKAIYNGIAIRFELPDLSGIAYLEDNVIQRFQLERKSFSIKYQDDEGDWTLIACDNDVRECIELSKSLKKTTIKMLIDPPIKYYAPR